MPSRLLVACYSTCGCIRETEREYAVALQQLALYAYKDLTQSHIESQCKEQFLAGLRSRELQSHLGLFCSRTATVQDVVSCAEAYLASRTEADLISDDEGVAVTIAYARAASLVRRLSSGLNLRRIRSLK